MEYPFVRTDTIWVGASQSVFRCTEPPRMGGEWGSWTSPLGADYTCIQNVDVTLNRNSRVGWPSLLELIIAVQLKGAPTQFCHLISDADLGQLAGLALVPNLSNPQRHVNNGVPSRDLVRFPAHPGCVRSYFGKCIGGQLSPAQSVVWQLFGVGVIRSRPLSTTSCFQTQSRIDVTVSGYVSAPQYERPTRYSERITSRRWNW